MFMELVQMTLLIILLQDLSMASREHPDSILPGHFEGDGHNVELDHEAFLGGEEAAKEFEELSEEESKERLSIILRKVDKNKDSFIDKDELTNWVKQSLKQIDRHNANEHLRIQDANQDGKLTWEEYNQHVFGYMPADDHNTETQYGKDVKRNEQTFKIADENQDGFLDAEEYLSFNNPRAVDKMQPVVIEQLLGSMDWNGDGAVDLQEFLGDYFNIPGSNEAPEWVAEESELFNTQLDLDGNGKLEGRELSEWVKPAYGPTATFEAEHLISQADANKDGQLTEKEVLDKYYIFAGSRATHFGRHIRDKNYNHEEL